MENTIKGLLIPKQWYINSFRNDYNYDMGKNYQYVDIKCSANWMWSLNKYGENNRLYKAAIALTEYLKSLSISIDGGKDSLSMKVQTKDKQDISAPGT